MPNDLGPNAVLEGGFVDFRSEHPRQEEHGSVLSGRLRELQKGLGRVGV